MSKLCTKSFEILKFLSEINCFAFLPSIYPLCTPWVTVPSGHADNSHLRVKTHSRQQDKTRVNGA